MRRKRKRKRHYEPKFYINSSWKPSKLMGEDRIVEYKMEDFRDTTLSQMNEVNKNRRPVNVPFRLIDTARKLQADRKLTVVLTDKGQGPALMKTENYNCRVWKNHLSKTDTYEQIGEIEAKDQMRSVAKHLEKLTRDNLSELPEYEQITFLQSFEPQRQCHYKMLQFYLMLKPHKGNDAVEHPVTTCCGSKMAMHSRWADLQLAELAKKSPTYLRGSTDLREKCNARGKLTPTTRFFLSDVIACYTNIIIREAIIAIEQWIHLYKDKLPEDFFPMEFLLEVLFYIMSENIFQYGDTWFCQVRGAAMGTSVACMCVTIVMGLKERAYLLQKYVEIFPMLTHFINDKCRMINDPALPLNLTDEEEKVWWAGNEQFKEYH